MNGHLLKPFQEAELRATVGHLLGLPVEVEVVPKSTPPMKSAFSLAHLTKLTNDDPKALARMLQLFLKSAGEHLEAMNTAQAQQDWDTISMRAHRLVPPVRHLGMEELVAELKGLEALAKAEKDWDSVSDGVDMVRSQLQTTIQAVETELAKRTD